MLWDSGTANPKRLKDLNPKYNLVYIAFAQGKSGSGGRLALPWNESPRTTKAEFYEDVKALRARGVRVVVSIGGERGHVDLTTHQKRTEALNSLIQMRENEFVFDGIDWDLEPSGASLSSNREGMYWISKQLKARYGKNFGILMAPQGHLVEYKQLARDLGDDLDFTGIQYYDYPASEQQRINDVMYRSRELVNNYGVHPSKIGIGFRMFDHSGKYVPDGTSTNWWSMQAALKATRDLEAQYPSMRGGYVWETGAENRNGDRWVRDVGDEIRN